MADERPEPGTYHVEYRFTGRADPAAWGRWLVSLAGWDCGVVLVDGRVEPVSRGDVMPCGASEVKGYPAERN
jgi:hypothetical protein